ncbi:hypothetical protein BGZ72_008560 [Mortierella alpina]|nr:hypothetical protein BGZ72_008560 [Mortierella alpina]
MFPALEVFKRRADPIVVYYKDGQCHAENEFEIASVQVTIEQQFVSTGEWRNWAIQENGDITMEKDRHSTFALVKSEGNEWKIVVEKWWGPHEGMVGAVQKGGLTVDFSLKVGDLDTAVRLRMQRIGL